VVTFQSCTGAAYAALAVSIGLLITASTAEAVGTQKGGSDWPCPQRKVTTLGASELQWEGPPVETVKDWRQDPAVNALVTTLANRRVPIEQAVKALKDFAQAVPVAERPARLTAVFAGLLETVNQYRHSVIDGIERFDKRQKLRAGEIEEEGIKLGELQKKADTSKDEASKAEYQKAVELYEWNTRVFEERRQNLPLACEIPPAIDARMFDLVREIRALMGPQPG